MTWLPCEVEALCIGAALKHFAPYILQLTSRAQVLTDSHLCVQAFAKLCRGEFSNSSRVTSFLSIVARSKAQISHMSGAANVPLDYTSQNPTTCDDRSCQVCSFADELSDTVVHSVTISDVLNSSSKMPFLNRKAWSLT